ncbi:MAG: hypothetical protein MZV63_63890 [Marinilabiliales bacterium]|nr:hypothetical protein [Marinilabiliales bacterium]
MLRNTSYEKIYRALGIVMLVMVIIVIITGDSSTWVFWVQVLAMFLLAGAFISLNFGTLVNRLTADSGKLTVRWYNRPGKVTVNIEDITEIHADESFVRIALKSGRIIRLPTGMLEFNEKRAVRKFLKEATGL